jgi:hypothetical protein
MRFLALVGLVALLNGCGLGVEEEAVTPDSEVTQQGPSETWCRSYTSQKYCPSVCHWYSYPAPGYCGLKPTSVTDEAEQTNECPGPAECITNRDCDVKCGGAGTGVCYAWTCYCAA